MDISVIALWLRHESIVSARMHMLDDLAVNNALWTGPPEATRSRYRSSDDTFDSEAYKGATSSNWGCNRLKNSWGLAMRSDKTARNYLASVQVAVVV